MENNNYDNYIINKINAKTNNRIKIAYNILINDFDGVHEIALEYMNSFLEGYLDFIEYQEFDFDENYFDSTMLENVLSQLDSKNHKEKILADPKNTNIYTFKVWLNRYKRQLYRTIRIPGQYSIMDFFSIVLSSFCIEKNQPFTAVIENENFIPEKYYKPDKDSFLSVINDDLLLGLIKFQTSQFKIHYGNNKEWVFVVEVEKIKENLDGETEFKITAGNGYGILEDNKEAFEYLFSKKEDTDNPKINAFIKENPDFDISCFSVKESNDYVNEKYQELKKDYLTKEE